MWHTSRGDRTLRGAEAELIGHSVDTMIDTLVDYTDDDWMDAEHYDISNACQSGVAIYDSLSASQRIALLHDVTLHLLTPTTSAMQLSAHAEAAVAAIFVEVRDQVAIEIDLFPDGFEDPSDDPEENVTWRQLVLAAYEAVFRSPAKSSDEFDFESDFEQTFERAPFPDDIPIPDDSCVEIHEWEYLIDSLSDAVLWDRDFEMADSFLDIDPGVSQQRRRLLGISDEYFSSIVPDPRPDEIHKWVSATRAIVRAKPR